MSRDGVDLFLTGRNETRLLETAKACRAKGAATFCQVMDVCDDQA